ncbi:MAG: ABC transporter ATP-binding protein [Candidatus Sericytochromatia bacterium]
MYDYLALYKFTGKALKLVWDTNKYLMIAICLLTIFIGILPAFIAYMSKIIVDGVLLANKNPEIINSAIFYVFLEGAIVISLEAGRKALMVSQSLLRALLGQKVNVLILEKALKLDLTHFENSEFYDKMTRARREASVRPLSLVNKTFAFIQSILSLVAYGALLIKFSYLAVLALIISSIPAFIAESKFANQAFKLFTWRAPETREQIYIETLIAREDYAKEVKLYQLGDLFLNKYKDIFNRLYLEDKELTIEKGIWSYLLGSLSTISFYFIYAWIIYETVKGKISLGEMTMYLMVFRQGQSALSSALNSISGMYEDNLYLSSLYEFLDQNIEKPDVENKIEVSHELLNNNNNLNEGIVFENVTFSYPNASKPAIENISFTIKKGEKLAIVGGNGSGKTTLIKLLTKLYTPEKGRILLDGKDLKDWDMNELHKRVGVIFQDFIHYQFSVSENIGVGDIDNIEDSNTIHKASEKGMALPFISNMPAGFKTQLGTWFRGGQELSLGQWQKIALSRAFMRKKADILVLDEPTSAMDAESEIEIFEQIRNLTENQMAILISHRFSTVRNADKIIVIEKGTILESGSHQELMELGGKYSKLFTLQANSFLN